MMQALPFRLIAVALLCGCAAVNAADGPALGLKPDGGLQLKLQPSLLRLPFDNTGPLPLFVDADNLQGHQDRELEAEGTVRLRRRGQAIYADWLRYDKPDDEVRARGNVRLEQHGDVLEGTAMQLHIESGRGVIEKPHYEVRVNATRGRGDGERIEMKGNNKYRILGGSYTSCDVGENDWFVRAKDFEIDKDRQIGTAHGAWVDFLGVPILYTPYLNFSLDRQRKSGFLSPTFGSTGNSGYEVSIPYYWNIAPNRDATFTPRAMSKRGEMLNSEFRYLGETYAGELRHEILPRDRVKNDSDRFAFNLRHNQSWGNGWGANVNIQKVSDDTYFTDLTTQIASTSQSILPRHGTVAKGGTWWNDGTWGATATVQRWQTLQTNPTQAIVAPYNRSQLTLAAAKQNVGYTDFDFSSSAVEFTGSSLPSGRRYIAYPSASLPLQGSFGYVTPKLGMHLTRYNFDPATTTAPDQTRSLPIFSTEGGVVFERNASLFGQGLLQTLEPKLYYVYIPTRVQNQIPNFDSAQQDISLATLFSENQFSGSDRINDANQLTTGITTRLLHQDSGIERLRVGVAQRYYFKAQEVTLPNVPGRGSNSSDLLAALSGTVAPHWTVDAGWQYTTDLSQTQRFNSSVRYQPEPGQVINLAYRYTNGAQIAATQPQNSLQALIPSLNTIRQIDVSSQWPISGRLSAVARYNYSIQDSKALETLMGLEYNAGCWAFRVVAHKFTTAAATQVSSVFMQLELNGLSKIGSNPLDLLRRNIGGYARPDLPAAQPDAFYPTR
jgi:LPS-assembly protein